MSRAAARAKWKRLRSARCHNSRKCPRPLKCITPSKQNLAENLVFTKPLPDRQGLFRVVTGAIYVRTRGRPMLQSIAFGNTPANRPLPPMKTPDSRRAFHTPTRHYHRYRTERQDPWSTWIGRRKKAARRKKQILAWIGAAFGFAGLIALVCYELL